MLAAVDLQNPFHELLAPKINSDQYHGLATMEGGLIRKFGCVVPTPEALQFVKEHCDKLIEIGAGSGYWAHLLAQMGLDVIATDIQPPERTWYPVHQADASIAAEHPDRALLLCWPDEERVSHMSSEALDGYLGAGGDRLLFVGEPCAKGCTGDEAFHRRITTDLRKVAQLDMGYAAPRIYTAVYHAMTT